MEDKFIKAAILLAASLSYCHFIGTKIPKGLSRLIFLLPIFYIFSSLPWYFSSVYFRGLSAFFVTWITSFKLLTFSFDRGPLVTCKNYVDFIIVAAFPLKIKEQQPPQPYPYPTFENLLKFLGLISPFLVTNEFQSPKPKLLLYAISILLGVYMIFTRGATLVQVMTRFELVHFSNRPYFATSLKDFWGRRWNRMSSNILRETIYDPTRESLGRVLGCGPAKTVAKVSTLVVSGAMHEVVFYYMTCGMRPSWEVTWYFVLQGFCMAFEAGLKQWVQASGLKPVSPWVSRFITVGFVMVTAYWLIVLPVWRSSRSGCHLI
ncbi:Wax synthase domain [Dillenia turbinata]|uniref:Wax synthase domain n=1 Tax=Dillenia turbinata TaxID=194707 RepID=A0AAN8VNL8_9MAGN